MLFALLHNKPFENTDLKTIKLILNKSDTPACSYRVRSTFCNISDPLCNSYRFTSTMKHFEEYERYTALAKPQSFFAPSVVITVNVYSIIGI